MLNELDTLERKLDATVSLCRDLRAQNNQLRQELINVEAEKRGLAERMEKARSRLERIAQQLPEIDILP
jgi:cell division protein ZapB